MENQFHRKVIEFLYNIRNKEEINLEDKEISHNLELISIIDDEINKIKSNTNLNSALTETLFSKLEFKNSNTYPETYGFKYVIFFLLPLILGLYFITNTNQKGELVRKNISKSGHTSLIIDVPELFSSSKFAPFNSRNNVINENKKSILLNESQRSIDNGNISFKKANKETTKLITKSFALNSDLDYTFLENKIQKTQFDPLISVPKSNSKFSITLSSVNSINDNNNKLENNYSGLISNFKIGISYDISKYVSLGLDFSQETLFLKYNSKSNEFQTDVIEQYTNTSSLYTTLKLKYPIENDLFAPYAKVSSGLNRFGVTNRAAFGVELSIFNNSRVFVELERNQVKFEHQNNTFSSFNSSINAGIIAPFTELWKIF